jgi:hypothetical protein
MEINCTNYGTTTQCIASGTMPMMQQGLTDGDILLNVFVVAFLMVAFAKLVWGFFN